MAYVAVSNETLRARPRLANSPCLQCSAREQSFCDALHGPPFERLAEIVSSKNVAPRSIVVQEGDHADILYNVVAGTLKLCRSLPDGRTQIIGFLQAGDFLGVPPGERYTVSAEAITPVELCCFPRRAFEQMLRDNPELERRLLGMSANELLAAQNHLLLLGRKTARERVASFLCQLASRRSQESSFDLPMTRTEIGDYLGLTMETVSRTLSAFRKEGLIAIDAPDRLNLKRLSQLAAVSIGSE